MARNRCASPPTHPIRQSASSSCGYPEAVGQGRASRPPDQVRMTKLKAQGATVPPSQPFPASPSRPRPAGTRVRRPPKRRRRSLVRESTVRDPRRSPSRPVRCRDRRRGRARRTEGSCGRRSSHYVTYCYSSSPGRVPRRLRRRSLAPRRQGATITAFVATSPTSMSRTSRVLLNNVKLVREMRQKSDGP